MPTKLKVLLILLSIETAIGIFGLALSLLLIPAFLSLTGGNGSILIITFLSSLIFSIGLPLFAGILLAKKKKLGQKLAIFEGLILIILPVGEFFYQINSASSNTKLQNIIIGVIIGLIILKLASSKEVKDFLFI